MRCRFCYSPLVKVILLGSRLVDAGKYRFDHFGRKLSLIKRSIGIGLPQEPAAPLTGVGGRWWLLAVSFLCSLLLLARHPFPGSTRLLIRWPWPACLLFTQRPGSMCAARRACRRLRLRLWPERSGVWPSLTSALASRPRWRVRWFFFWWPGHSMRPAARKNFGRMAR